MSTELYTPGNIHTPDTHRNRRTNLNFLKIANVNGDEIRINISNVADYYVRANYLHITSIRGIDSFSVDMGTLDKANSVLAVIDAMVWLQPDVERYTKTGELN
jgi:hypothetical protein